jgi:release factor glutamine methyltransferase
MITTIERDARQGQDSRPPTLGNAIKRARQALKNASDTPWQDALILMAAIFGKRKAWTLAHPETALNPSQWDAFEQATQKLEAGMPLPYVLGHWEFFGLEFELTPAVLIPRPETELLVEEAIAFLKKAGDPERLHVADVGTGSGAIAVSLAKTLPGLKVLAVDRSRAALEVARRNAVRHHLGRVISFFEGSLLEAARGPFDLIAANLPYIPSQKLDGLPVAAHEPRLALDGGPGGLSWIAALISDTPRLMRPGGLLLLEIEETQGGALTQLAMDRLPQARLEIKIDLSGRDRLGLIYL